MKVLAINSSPNMNGATAKLVDMFLDRCSLKGAESERIDLQDYLIGTCGNCLKCKETNECIYNDDLLQLKAKILNSEGILIASPYFSGKSSEDLEALVDRLKFSSKDNKIFKGKYFVGLSVSLHDDASSVAEYCGTLGGIVNGENGILAGLISVSRITDCGIGEVDEDISVKEKIENLADKLMNDMKVLKK